MHDMPFLVAARPCVRLALNYLDTWQYICCQYKLAVGYCCQYMYQFDLLSTDDVSGSAPFLSPIVVPLLRDTRSIQAGKVRRVCRPARYRTGCPKRVQIHRVNIIDR